MSGAAVHARHLDEAPARSVYVALKRLLSERVVAQANDEFPLVVSCKPDEFDHVVSVQVLGDPSTSNATSVTSPADVVLRGVFSELSHTAVSLLSVFVGGPSERNLLDFARPSARG